MELQEEFHETGFLRWRRMFPWLHLLRVPGITARMPILLVGLVTSLLLVAGFQLTGESSGSLTLPLWSTTPADYYAFALEASSPIVMAYQLWASCAEFQSIREISGPLAILLIHIISGLIICRAAGSAFTTGSCTRVRSSVADGLRNLPAAGLSLLLPVMMLGLLGALIWGTLAANQIPILGEILYGPGLLLSLIAIVFSLGLVFGWPLLIPAIAIEGGDGFDAWSRCFDYVRSRSVSIVISFVLAMFLGILLFQLLGELQRLTFAWMDGMRDANGRYLVSLWQLIWLAAFDGFRRAYFWVTVTAVYVLTRYSVDRIPMSEFRE
ncbi:hypothetical protein [Rubinisphaera margarita]|uniref:hypothetical protein n=1 Tax=Rubinisphaera margarita TaxID=2909586 RepID=UPI001EE94302|nr:hypothetical protein [Rubinisphaera margarita]MCG6156227.1 hypothetical protein [Rubinisphaera margarita]